MNRETEIIRAIDEFLNKENKTETTPVEVNPYLEEKGILNDSNSRKGKPLRDKLRKGGIPHAYQIGNRWIIPKSGNGNVLNTLPDNAKSVNKLKSKEEKILTKNHKLEPIAEKIAEIFEKKFGEGIDFVFEYKPDWLETYPRKNGYENNWDKVKKVYSILNETEFEIEEQMNYLKEKDYNKTQAFDIWFKEPYNFAVEFDEKQHFNQFRKQTLDYYDTLNVGFDVKLYKKYNNKIKNAGTSGFTKLKSKDPLFPELLKGDKQDNRVRQRAFRDFLKDIRPIEKGFNPTLRISFNETNGKIKDFTKIEVENLTEYIEKQIDKYELQQNV